MKIWAVVFLLFGAELFAQCDSGKVWMWGMSSTGCYFESGCYTVEEAKELRKFIDQCICEETSFCLMSLDMYGLNGKEESHVWDDSLGCTVKYFKIENGEKTPITAEEYLEL